MILQLVGTLLRKIAMSTQLSFTFRSFKGQTGDDELGVTYYMCNLKHFCYAHSGETL